MGLQAENEQLKQENAELCKALNDALQTIKELKSQLAQSSRNSHWPAIRDKGKKQRLTKGDCANSQPEGGERG